MALSISDAQCKQVGQGMQASDALDKAVAPSIPGQRSATATERAGLEPGQPVAAARVAAQDQELVADELPASADEDGGRLVKHARYYWLLPAEGHLNRPLFGDMLQRNWALPRGQRCPREDRELLAPERSRSERCRPERRSALSINVCERPDESWLLPEEVMCTVPRENMCCSERHGSTLQPCEGQNGNPGLGLGRPSTVGRWRRLFSLAVHWTVKSSRRNRPDRQLLHGRGCRPT